MSGYIEQIISLSDFLKVYPYWFRLAFLFWLVATALLSGGLILLRVPVASLSLANLPRETGWIFAGYYDEENNTFVEGPYVSIIDTNRRGLRKFVMPGDTIQTKVTRRVIVIDYKISSRVDPLISPIMKGVIDANDETGVIIAKETKLLVRDVSEGKWPDNPNVALWLRVVELPE